MTAAPSAAFVLVAIAYAVLRTYQLHLADSDETIYFYMALRTVTGGLLPYRDYFFAHPPLHLAFAVVALKLGAIVHGASALLEPSAWEEGGVALVWVKSIGIVVGVAGGAFIYRAVRRVSGRLEGFLAGALFLFSPDLLHSFFTGVAEALMFAALGLERVTAGRDRQAGLAYAAGALVAMYIAPCGLAVWLVLLARDRRRASTLALWTAAPLLLVHGLFLAWAGRAYLDQVFLFHAHKPKVGAVMPELWLLLHKSSALVMAVPASVVALWRGTWRGTFARAHLVEERAALAATAMLSLALTLLFVSATRAVFHYYFVMLMLGMAPLAGLAYGELARRLALVLRVAVAPARRRALGAAALSALTILVWPLAGRALGRLPSARGAQFPVELVGKAAPRTWRPSPVLGRLNDVVYAFAWRDVEILGDDYPPWTRFLWDASQRFEILEPFVTYARDNLPPGATIFGDPTLADAVALLSARHVALDEADTNFMRFASGATSPAVFVLRLRAAPPALVLFSVGEYPLMGDEIHRFLDTYYESSLANDARGLVYVVMRPRPALPSP